mmetsp:Transcript_35379/g.77885  ORF Transcript_35379/g.77885 Transcript_35379/m.77885 type:complete len:227 (+) Transcript_35379:632-1312(+)
MCALSGRLMSPLIAMVHSRACISAVGGMEPNAGRAKPKNPISVGKSTEITCLKFRRGFMPAWFSSGWCLSRKGKVLRNPVQATIASQGNCRPSSNTALSAVSVKEEPLNSCASRRTIAATNPSFLQPNLEKADVPCSRFSSLIFASTRPSSLLGCSRLKALLVSWLVYPIRSPRMYGLEYRQRLVFKSVTRPSLWMRGIMCPCLPRMAMPHVAATLDISLQMSDPD